MSESRDHPGIPKSIRHKRILDIAEENPDTSIDELVAEITWATPDLIERVFNEYGDSANEIDDASLDVETPAETDDTPAPDDDEQESSPPDPEALPEKQRETLRAIYEHPEAIQRELAELLDVSGSTVSTRVNTIDGFDWVTRASFATAVFDEDSPPTREGNITVNSTGKEISSEPRDDVETRLTNLEHQLADMERSHA